MDSPTPNGKGKGKGKARDPSPSLDEHTHEPDATNNRRQDETSWEEGLEAPQTENERISAVCTRLRTMEERDALLAHGATPGASGSSPRFRRRAADSVNARATPAACGQPASEKLPVQPDPNVQTPPQSTRVPIPKPQHWKIGTIRDLAKLSENSERWNRINHIIRTIMIRKGVDHSVPWQQRDKPKMDGLYDEILKEVPELGNFEENWGVIELVRKKFNNQNQNLKKGTGNKPKRDDVNERHPPAPSSNHSYPRQPASRSSTPLQHSRPPSPRRTGSPRSPSPPWQPVARSSTPQPSSPLRHSRTEPRNASPTNILSPRANSPPPAPNLLQPAPPRPRSAQRPPLVDYGSTPSPPPDLAHPQPQPLPPVDPRADVQPPNPPSDPPPPSREPTPGPGPGPPAPPRSPPPPYALVEPQTPGRRSPPPYSGRSSPATHQSSSPPLAPRRSMGRRVLPRHPPSPVAGPSRQPQANAPRQRGSASGARISSPILIMSSSPSPEPPSQNKKRKREGSEQRGKDKRTRHDDSDYSPSDGTDSDDGGGTSSSQDL